MEHLAFIARIAEERKRAATTGSLLLDLVHFLHDGLIDHIVVSDKAYAEVTRSNKTHQPSLLARFFTRFF